MLESVIAAYVESLSERELDMPLHAILRAEGYFDIEFVHGVSEYGRDFIAKRRDEDDRVRQYSVQSKAGDLGITEWRGVRDQLEDIRTVPMPHPLYDQELQQSMLVVHTGRLVGDARGAAAAYPKTLPPKWSFEIWTGERLERMLAEHLEAALSEQARGPLLSLLGAIDEGTLDHRQLERHSRRWIPEPDHSVHAVDVLEASLVANRLHASMRLDLACVCALAVLRAHLVAYADEEPFPEQASRDVQEAGEFFAHHAEALWARCDEPLLHPEAMVNTHPEFGFWVTYPVRCLRLAELLGLLGLWRRQRGANAEEIADWLSRFLAGQPGAAHPISDRWALSLIPPALLLAPGDDAVLTSWMRRVIRWVADRYEGESLGVAGVDATPEIEVDYMLGDLEHIDLPKRRESLVAGVLLDLASLLELADIFDDARHEFLAVEIVPDLRHPPDGRDAWRRDGEGMRQELNPPYLEASDQMTGGWKTAPHHDADAQALWAVRVGLEWEALAVWCLLRDRFTVPLLRLLADK